MHTQVSEQYRKTGQSLYKLTADGSAYRHCAIVPSRCKTLAAAVEWYEEQQYQKLSADSVDPAIFGRLA
jgi:hypothetical protein